VILRLQGELIEKVDDGMHTRGWTQKQLAAKVGISEKHLSQMLNGRVMGTLVIWDRLLILVDEPKPPE
jgi:transcriptional regulator with XRE-family HTH domain